MDSRDSGSTWATRKRSGHFVYSLMDLFWRVAGLRTELFRELTELCRFCPLCSSFYLALNRVDFVYSLDDFFWRVAVVQTERFLRLTDLSQFCPLRSSSHPALNRIDAGSAMSLDLLASRSSGMEMAEVPWRERTICTRDIE
jgi:hypothetical protein